MHLVTSRFTAGISSIRCFSALQAQAPFQRHSTDSRIKLTLRDLFEALKAKPLDYRHWNGANRIKTLLNLSPTLRQPQVYTTALLKNLEEYENRFTARLPDPSAIPVFSSDGTSYRYAGTVGKMVDEAARQKIISGHCVYFSEHMDVKTSQNRVKTTDIIITGDPETIDDEHFLGKNLIALILQEVIRKANGPFGISENDPYSDTLVYQYNRDGNRQEQTVFKFLGSLHDYYKSGNTIKDDNYSMIGRHSRKITQVSNGRYKEVAALVLGRRGVDPRDLWDQSIRWSSDSEKQNRPPSRVKTPAAAPELPPSPIPFTREEITSALHKELCWEIRDLNILAMLPSAKIVKKNSKLKDQEWELANATTQGVYLDAAVERHYQLHPGILPVFAARKQMFVYAGPINSLFDLKTREYILNGNYKHQYSLLSAWRSGFKGRNESDLIIVDGDKSERTFIEAILHEKIHLAAKNQLSENDSYANIPLYLSDELKVSKNRNYSLKDLSKMSESTKKFVYNGNFTLIFPYGAIVLGTRTAQADDVFNFQSGY